MGLFSVLDTQLHVQDCLGRKSGAHTEVRARARASSSLPELTPVTGHSRDLGQGSNGR